MWKKGMGKSKAFFLGFITALVLSVTFGGIWLMLNTLEDIHKVRESGSAEPVQAESVLAQQTVQLILRSTYVCGTEVEEKLTKTVPSIEQVYLDYHDWELVSQQGNTLVFKRFIHDLSPVCREKGYFGISPDGSLTLYEGPPEEEKVIQTFFQIDTKKLESGLLKDDLELLKKGIRIHDLSEYNSILSTYGEYANGASDSSEVLEERPKPTE